VVNTSVRVAALKASAAWEGADLSQQCLGPECAALLGLSQNKPNVELPGFVSTKRPAAPGRAKSDCSRGFLMARAQTSLDLGGPIPWG